MRIFVPYNYQRDLHSKSNDSYKVVEMLMSINRRWSDRGATSPSNDPLHRIRGPMTRFKTKRMKQALQGLTLNVKEKEHQCELRVAPNWVTFLQIDEDALRPT